MKRIDSGFQDSFLLKAPHDDPPSTIVRSNTAPSRRRRPQKSSVDTTGSICPTEMKSQRPESEKRSRPSHQRSKTSSSETSITRSKGRHTSKPSSRRTSCTIVDPSRSRHYRIQSSHTVPTVNSQDIDDVYALHHRSYNMFQNPSLHTSSGLPSPTKSRPSQSDVRPSTSSFSGAERFSNEQDDHPKQSEDTIVAAPRPSTAMQWTSPCTRQREYERIDRANRGVRGFMNKVMPRCVSGPQEKFYEKDQSDTCSVRRYRLDEDDVVAHEKELARSQTHTVKKSTATNKKKWICF